MREWLPPSGPGPTVLANPPRPLPQRKCYKSSSFGVDAFLVLEKLRGRSTMFPYTLRKPVQTFNTAEKVD